MKKSLVLTLLCTVAAPIALATEAPDAAVTTAVAPVTAKAVEAAALPEVTVDDTWKACQFAGSKLAVQTHAARDKSLQPFFDRTSKALLRAALTPNAAVDVATTELDELIASMKRSSSSLAGGETQAVLKDADVSSLGETRTLLQNLIEQYEKMKEDVVPHLVWTCEVARALHNAMAHEQGKIDKCKATLATKQPDEVIQQTQDFIVRAEADIARLKNTLLCVIGVGRAMYPDVLTEASTISTIVSSFSWVTSVVSSPSASSEATLKSVVGVEQVPATLELVMPDPIKNRAYYEFLQKMLGHETWVSQQAFEKGRLKWVVEPKVGAVTHAVTPPPSLVDPTAATECRATPKQDEAEKKKAEPAVVDPIVMTDPLANEAKGALDEPPALEPAVASAGVGKEPTTSAATQPQDGKKKKKGK